MQRLSTTPTHLTRDTLLIEFDNAGELLLTATWFYLLTSRQISDNQTAFLVALAPYFKEAVGGDNVDLFINSFFKIYTKRFLGIDGVPEDFSVQKEVTCMHLT